MRWKEFVLMPAAVVTVCMLWITWEASRTKTEQEELFQVPVSDDPQVYVDFMRQMNAEFGYIRSAEKWHFIRAYDSMREAAERLRELLPPGERLPPFAALSDITYRAGDSFSYDRLSAEEVQAVLDDFQTFLDREDVLSVLQDDPGLTNTLPIMLSLMENQGHSKEAMLEYAASLETKIFAFDDSALHESVKETLAGFRNRIRLLETPYRLTGDTIAGDVLDTAEFAGKIVFIEFWSTTCQPCVAELPTLLSVYDDHQKDLAVVGVSKDRSKRKLERFAADRSIPWPQLWMDHDVGNSELFDTLGISMIPYSIVLDPKGRVIAFNVRAHELDESLEDWR